MQSAKIKIKQAIEAALCDYTKTTACALGTALLLGVVVIWTGCVNGFTTPECPLPAGTKIIFTSPALANEFRAAANLETNRTGAVVELPTPATLTLNSHAP